MVMATSIYRSSIYFSSVLAVLQCSFGPVFRAGNEATDGSTTLDIGVPVFAEIIPPIALLPTDTVVTVSVSGGNATGRST